MEKKHDENYYDKVKTIKEYGFIDEFIIAVKEEEASYSENNRSLRQENENVKPLDITDIFLRVVRPDIL